MQPGAITSYIDVAQLVLYAFWIFFAGLIYYLHRENKREGYPLLTERKGVTLQGFPFVPTPKKFLLSNGTVIYAPRAEEPEVLNAVPTARFPGAPYQPIGNPMLSGMGPGAWARRADHPDLSFDDNLPKIVPLRAASAFFLAEEDPEMIGYEVVGLDGEVAGKIVDVWVDRSEYMVRYLEVELAHPVDARHVLFPMHYTEIDRKRQRVGTNFITGAQFATVPATRSPDTVTLLEEDKITAYYAGGMLYAVPGRAEPLL
jgi:photosynthetic reaction center H subunit